MMTFREAQALLDFVNDLPSAPLSITGELGLEWEWDCLVDSFRRLVMASIGDAGFEHDGVDVSLDYKAM